LAIANEHVYAAIRLRRDDDIHQLRNIFQQHITLVEQVTSRNETAWEANMMEADLREARGDKAGARAAWESGLKAAQARGDKQVEKELLVFIKRLDKDAAVPQ
jgi:hypothetical protein